MQQIFSKKKVKKCSFKTNNKTCKKDYKKLNRKMINKKNHAMKIYTATKDQTPK